ncbi:hypothetical protein AKO1_010151 [Acrasis kona]|uniref:Uncharacterized protein n=1 Tax=Acrasis kona TaxID=1008807 RepID=A0AAW2ZTE2_9EUKA
MPKVLITLFFICLLVSVFAHDLNVAPPPSQQKNFQFSMQRQVNTAFQTFILPIGNTLSSKSNNKISIRCPKEQKSSPIGGGNVRRPSKYFLAEGYKLAASCRIDCMSKVAGQVHFDGGCKKRYYYYGNVGHCLLSGDLTNEQAKLAEAYCMGCNGCIKRHNREFNVTSAKKSVGDNSKKLPQ